MTDTPKTPPVMPCIFCMSADLELTTLPHSRFTSFWHVHCRACDAYGPGSVSGKESTLLWEKRRMLLNHGDGHA